jgi:hypothetical protein
MTDPARRHDVVYVQTDVPAGMTMRDWRAQRAANPRVSRRWWRLICGIRDRATVGVRQVIAGALNWLRNMHGRAREAEVIRWRPRATAFRHDHGSLCLQHFESGACVTDNHAARQISASRRDDVDVRRAPRLRRQRRRWSPPRSLPAGA